MIAHLVATGCALMVYAIVAMVCAPLLVSGRRWTSRLPRQAISLWIGALGSGAIALLASLVCAIWAASLLGGERRQPLSARSIAAGLGLTLGTCALLALVGGLVAVVGYHVALGIVSRRHLYGSLRLVGRSRSGLAPVRFVESDQPVALSMPGRAPMIVVSTGMRAVLTAEQLAAVVEHERGHLLQRHHRLVQLAVLQHRCVPVLPCARSLERSVHVLVELAADDYAARRCGRATLAGALRSLNAVTGDVALSLRASRLESLPSRVVGV